MNRSIDPLSAGFIPGFLWKPGRWLKPPILVVVWVHELK